MTDEAGISSDPIVDLKAKLIKADRFGPSRLICVFPLDNADGTMDMIYMFQQKDEVIQYRYKVREDAELDSLSDLYKGAWNMEREAIDMFGIRFKGVPGGIFIMPETGIKTPLLKPKVPTTGSAQDVAKEAKKDV